jgi:hypothetical protein
MEPHLDVIERQRAVLQCRESFKGKADIPAREQYCNCLMDLLQTKYGTLKLADSIIRAEQLQAVECLSVFGDSAAYNAIHH